MRRLRGSRLAAATFLFLFAPVSAEYLIGYDELIGNPAALVFGLVAFAPLYGAPALLVREVTRRTGRGWPTILLLGTAFGFIEAGLIDQGLFDPDYRDIPYWETMREPTLVPGIGTSAWMLVHFVSLHVFGTIAAPIALAEALAPERQRTAPWLGRLGLTAMGSVWLAAGLYVAIDTRDTESFTLSTGQAGLTILLVAGLIVAALTRPPARIRTAARAAPAALTVAAFTFITLGVRPALAALSPHGTHWNAWPATILAAALTALWIVCAWRWSRRPGWNDQHTLAAAAGYLLAVATIAFGVDPLGNVPATTKLAVNTILLALVVVLVTTASRQHTSGVRRRV